MYQVTDTLSYGRLIPDTLVNVSLPWNISQTTHCSRLLVNCTKLFPTNYLPWEKLPTHGPMLMLIQEFYFKWVLILIKKLSAVCTKNIKTKPERFFLLSYHINDIEKNQYLYFLFYIFTITDFRWCLILQSILTFSTTEWRKWTTIQFCLVCQELWEFYHHWCGTVLWDYPWNAPRVWALKDWWNLLDTSNKKIKYFFFHSLVLIIFYELLNQRIYLLITTYWNIQRFWRIFCPYIYFSCCNSWRGSFKL